MDWTEQQLVDLLGEGAHGYFAGGAGDELTLADNEAAWPRITLSPRILVDVGERDLSVDLLGRSRAHPVVIAPTAYQKHAHPDGELATARAAAATDTIMTLSSQSTTAPGPIADAMGSSPRWFQLYVFKDRAVSRDLVDQARESGFEALVLTVDFPVAGWRERDRRTGFRVSHPVAVNPSGRSTATADLFDQHDPTLTWDDIGAFAEQAQMPLILKGILRPDDAERAIDAGAAGVVVSNHGGRQLDTVLAGADALAPVVDAVAGRCDVLVDGGVRRGWDVAKALAIGADAVMVGRPVLWGLATNGADGVRAVIDQIVAELDSTLALLGVPRARDLSRDALAHTRGPLDSQPGQ